MPLNERRNEKNQPLTYGKKCFRIWTKDRRACLLDADSAKDAYDCYKRLCEEGTMCGAVLRIDEV
jgi:hypothetical protein